MRPCTDLPVEEVLPDGSGRALGGRVPAQVLQLLVNPFQRHLYTPSSICKQVQIYLFRDLSGALVPYFKSIVFPNGYFF